MVNVALKASGAFTKMLHVPWRCSVIRLYNYLGWAEGVGHWI